MAGHKRHILVIRLSALGDVAMLRPILTQRALANPDVLFTIAAPAMLSPLFEGIPNIRFLATQKKQSVKKLYEHLASVHPTEVADMHHVNRVVAACCLFRLHGTPVFSIRKHTLLRNRRVRQRCKVRTPMLPVWRAYDMVFDRMKLQGNAVWPEMLMPKALAATRTVGIAPFAQHKGKIWPVEQMERIVSELATDERTQVVLFGGKSDAAILDQWAAQYPRVTSLAGKGSFAEELQQIGKLSVMVSMDSANMHFASCLRIPVVSIWGATHPLLGFYGWGQDPRWAVQKDFACRPCSVYGKKPCRYGDYRCLKSISPEAVLEAINAISPLEKR